MAQSPRTSTLRAAVSRALKNVAGWLSGGDPSQKEAGGLIDGDSGEFDRLLTQAPVKDPADRKVLARILVEVAKADMELTPAEREFLAQFIDPSLGSVEELARMPRLTADELEATRPEARPTMLLLAWTVAFSDRDLSLPELSRLRVLARGLRLEADTAEEVRRAALAHILYEAMEHTYRSGRCDADSHQEVQAFAANAGLTPANLKKYEDSAKARLGIA